MSAEPLVVPPPEADEAPDGVLGEVLEPAPAEPLLIVAEPDIDEPAEPDGVDGVALDEEDDEPDGVDGALDEPDADEEPVPEGEVVVPREAALSFLSHAVSMLAPKATDSASASVESFMGPP